MKLVYKVAIIDRNTPIPRTMHESEDGLQYAQAIEFIDKWLLDSLENSYTDDDERSMTITVFQRPGE